MDTEHIVIISILSFIILLVVIFAIVYMVYKQQIAASSGPKFANERYREESKERWLREESQKQLFDSQFDQLESQFSINDKEHFPE